MLYYDRIDVSEEIDINRTSPSKECDVCHNWYFLNYSFKFQPNVCNNRRVAKRSPSWEGGGGGGGGLPSCPA